MSIKLETKICKEDLVHMLDAYFLTKYNSVLDVNSFLVVQGKDGSTDFRHLISIEPNDKDDELNLTVNLTHVIEREIKEKAA